MTATATLEHADQAAATVLQAPASPAIRLLGTLSEVADQPPLIALCTATLVAGWIGGSRRLSGAGGAMLASVLVAAAAKSAVKRRVDRTRPRAVAAGEPYRMVPGDSAASDDNSFPSGHTAGAVAVARALGRGYPGARGPALGVAAAVALVQVPRGKHYPTDLAAGAAVGLAAEAVVHAAIVGLAAAYRVGTGSAPE